MSNKCKRAHTRCCWWCTSRNFSLCWRFASLLPQPIRSSCIFVHETSLGCSYALFSWNAPLNVPCAYTFCKITDLFTLRPCSFWWTEGKSRFSFVFNQITFSFFCWSRARGRKICKRKKCYKESLTFWNSPDIYNLPADDFLIIIFYGYVHFLTTKQKSKMLNLTWFYVQREKYNL